MAIDSRSQPIPVSAAKRVAQTFGKTAVVIVSIGPDDLRYGVTTYGEPGIDRIISARVARQIQAVLDGEDCDELVPVMFDIEDHPIVGRLRNRVKTSETLVRNLQEELLRLEAENRSLRKMEGIGA